MSHLCNALKPGIMTDITCSSYVGYENTEVEEKGFEKTEDRVG